MFVFALKFIEFYLKINTDEDGEKKLILLNEPRKRK